MVSSTDIRQAVEARRSHLFDTLAGFIRHPSVHGDDPAACRAAADEVRAAFAAEGYYLDPIETEDGSIALVGEHPAGPGQPTVLLYSHYDVQPSGEASTWTSDPWQLTERDGRWYGRGAADCKGNIVMHLAALHALTANGIGGVGLRIVVEGSEERGSAGLENLIRTRPELFRADAILIADTGNVAVGQPTLGATLRGSADVTVHVDTLAAPVHSGMYGGPAPDALAALIRLLDGLRDADGQLSIDGLPSDQRWTGRPYPTDTFRGDVGALDGTALLLGEGTEVADVVWAQPALTVTALDALPLDRAINAVPAHAAAHLNLRIPPGVDPAEAQDRLVEHLLAHAPWGARVSIDRDPAIAPFAANTGGPAYQLLSDSLAEAFGQPTVTVGEGGSIPLCTTLTQAVPDAELMLFGVEEPQCRIHSADESVDPRELMSTAVAEALFLARFAGRTVR